MDKPDDLIELGRIAEAYGLKGWVNVLPSSESPEVLLKAKQWWISRPSTVTGTGTDVAQNAAAVSGLQAKLKSNAGGSTGANSGGKGNTAGASNKSALSLIYEPFKVLACKIHADRLVAHLEGSEDRTVAESLKGRRIHVSRSRFPALPEGEYYWVDLQGCAVSNLQGQALGEVAEVVSYGAHPVLVVRKGESECLIPFVMAYVPEVRLAERSILVDWQEDYS